MGAGCVQEGFSQEGLGLTWNGKLHMGDKGEEKGIQVPWSPEAGSGLIRAMGFLGGSGKRKLLVN